MNRKLLSFMLTCLAFCLMASNFPSHLQNKPAKLKRTDNLCKHLPYIDSIWGLNMQGNREKLDSLAIMLNIDRKLGCDFQLSDMGANVIKMKLSNTFNDPKLLETYMFNHAERYRNVNFNGEINANMFIAPDGSYMGHEVLEDETFKVFKPLAKYFPFYMLEFTPAEQNQKAVMDTVKVIIRVQMEEELFVGN